MVSAGRVGSTSTSLELFAPGVSLPSCPVFSPFCGVCSSGLAPGASPPVVAKGEATAPAVACNVSSC
eukprot:3740840-Amphidinium_carterae.1